MRGKPLLAIVVVAAVGCTGDEERTTSPTTTATEPTPPTTTAQPTTTEEEPPDPVALVAMPARALRECRRLPTLRPACPELVPEAPYDPGSPIFVARSRGGIPHPSLRGFELQWGAEHPGRPDLDRPPATVHVVVSEGWAVRLAARRRTPVRDGLLEERRRRPLLLGRVRWAGKRGQLFLAPPFPRGGIEANHLRFVWSDGGRSYGISLHGWEPFTEMPGVLRAIVESRP